MHAVYDSLHDILVGPLSAKDAAATAHMAPEVITHWATFDPERFLHVMPLDAWVTVGHRIDCVLRSSQLAAARPANDEPYLSLLELTELLTGECYETDVENVAGLLFACAEYIQQRRPGAAIDKRIKQYQQLVIDYAKNEANRLAARFGEELPFPAASGSTADA